MRLVTVAIYPVRLLLFHYETKLNRVGFILNRMSFSEKLFFIIFQGCFTVQLSRFLQSVFHLESLTFPRKNDCFLCFRFALFLSRQQILSYQITYCLSTLFLTFFVLLFKVSAASTRFILPKTSKFVNTFFYFFIFSPHNTTSLPRYHHFHPLISYKPIVLRKHPERYLRHHMDSSPVDRQSDRSYQNAVLLFLCIVFLFVCSAS